MKLNFSIDMTPDEFTSLANAEVEAQRIREGLKRDNFEREFAETEARIKAARRDVNEKIAEFEKEYERISKEIHEASKPWGTL